MKLKVAFLDVFHGDCTVVTFDEPDRKACIVIDAAENIAAARRLTAYLKHEQIEVIDLLVATHIDSDHINGLLKFLKSESKDADSWNRGKDKCIRYYWGPKPDPDYKRPSTKTRAQMSPLAASKLHMLDFVIESVGQNQDLNEFVKKYIVSENNMYYPSLEDMPPLNVFNNVKLELMAPDVQVLDSDIQAKALSINNFSPAQTLTEMSTGATGPLNLDNLKEMLALNTEAMATIADRTANNQSIVFKLTPETGSSAGFRTWTFLFSGDAESDSWEMMRQTPEVAGNLPSRVLKVPHHGSRNGMNEAAFAVINPEYSIISAGQKHGLPDEDTLNIIKRDTSRKLFCTERNNKDEPKDRGACLEKSNCPRRKPSDFRSLGFIIDTDSGDVKNELFTIDDDSGAIEIKVGEVWCPETAW